MNNGNNKKNEKYYPNIPIILQMGICIVDKIEISKMFLLFEISQIKRLSILIAVLYFDIFVVIKKIVKALTEYECYNISESKV